MQTPFRTIQILGDPTDQQINQIQANISASFNSLSTLNPVTRVSQPSYSVQSTDTILAIDTTQIQGNTSTIILPDATQCNGFSFGFMKQDTTSNPINFFTSAKTRQGAAQLAQGATSPFITTASLASGYWFSDGNGWWLIQ